MKQQSQPQKGKEPVPITPRKKIYLTLPYCRDIAVQLAQERLSTALNRAYNAPNLISLYETQHLPIPSMKSHDSVVSTSHFIYKLTCSCGEYSIDRTDRMLGNRAKKQLPKWLLSARDGNKLTDPEIRARTPTSSIARHILSTGHIKLISHHLL